MKKDDLSPINGAAVIPRPIAPVPVGQGRRRPRFATAHAAAAHFGCRYLPPSLGEDREYGTVIYRMYRRVQGRWQWVYAYPPPRRGQAAFVVPRIPWLHLFFLVASAHTHGAAKPGYDVEHFSRRRGRRLNDLGWCGLLRLPGYLITPRGVLRYYDPKTGAQQLLPCPALRTLAGRQQGETGQNTP